MEKLIVACVQPRVRVFDTIDDYIADIRRYMNVAIHQDAELIVFPELLGLMIAPTLMDNSRSLRGRQSGQNSIFQRANLSFLPAFGSDLRDEVSAFLKSNAAYINQLYVDIFSNFAREYKMTIVAPSGYLPDPLSGVLRNMAGVFSASGDQLGYQSKTRLSSADKGMVSAGRSWTVIPTDVGNLGLVLGEDIFFPKVCQLLAHQGAEIIIALAACDQPITSNRVRINAIARAQEMQLFTVLSYAIGDNLIAKKKTGVLTGHSSIIGPRELTVNDDNLFIAISEGDSEGVITAELDFAALRNLHEVSNRPQTQPLSSDEKRKMMLSIENEMAQPLPPNFDVAIIDQTISLEPTAASHKEATEMYTLDELPIIASISARWPLMPFIDIIEPVIFEEFSGTAHDAVAPQTWVRDSDGSDDETEEMDALIFDSETPID